WIAPLVSVVFLLGIFLAGQALLAIGDPLIIRFDWLPGLPLGWMLDRISLALILLVYLVSFLVHLFSIYYLKGDPGIYKYFGFLGFFTSSMVGLLSADHLLLLFVFWELVGFSSFLLIGFWYKHPEKTESARTAFMTNRIADVCLLAGILLLWADTGNALLSELSMNGGGTWITWAALGMVIGAMGKSAQFPFHTWLPHAMAGPTPVSALIHAATMVAAGVYLLVRVAPSFPVEVQGFAALIGGTTALLGAFFAFTQNDIKRVLAYSTISQLGYMFMAAGAGAVQAGFFHLWTHAFFKAGLFLCAGVIIHTMGHVKPESNPQDMTQMIGMRSRLPVTFAAFTICLLALVGLPLFSGFFSKDAILISLWYRISHLGAAGGLALLMGGAVILGTAYYMGRQWWMVFGDQSREARQSEPWLTVRLPLVVLALGSFWFWYAWSPLAHEFPLLAYLFPIMPDATHVPWVAPVAVGLVIAGWWLAFRFRGRFGQPTTNVVLRASNRGLFLDLFYHRLLVLPYGRVAGWATFVDTKVIDGIIRLMAVSVVVLGKVAGLWDRWIIDGFVNFTAYLSQRIGGVTRSIQSRAMQTQMFWLLVGVAALVFCGIFYLPGL
ncbi:MAG: NADH-quinone oxidoreductase subunit L, partial [Bacteroidota bacterium]